MSTKNGLGPGTMDINGKKFATFVFEHDGTRYTMRALKQNEIDDAFDAATGPDTPDGKPGKVNYRLLNRMQLAKSVVEPAVTVDSLGELPSPEFSVILGHFNDLHTLPEANPTVPAGSAGPTSPGGGAPLPTT